MKVLVVFALAIVAVLGDDFNSRVVGGKEAPRNAAPYIVSLQRGTSHFCGGSIIAANRVLTAAHCVKPGDSVNVVAGLHTLGESGTQTRKAVRIINHEKYSGQVAPFDISLLFLDTPFIFNANVAAIALPAAGKINAGDVTLYGWGSISKTSSPSMPKNLQTVTKPIIEYSKCVSVMGSKSPLADTNVCTGPLEGGISACSGDSGGPLVQNSNGRTELVGIVSWGTIPCGTKNKPSVYTRVSAYNDWIATKTATYFLMNALNL